MTDLHKGKKVRRLKNLQISEVSLVDRPANLRNFLLFKRHTPAIEKNLRDTDGRPLKVDEILALMREESDEEKLNKAFDALSHEEKLLLKKQWEEFTLKVELAMVDYAFKRAQAEAPDIFRLAERDPHAVELTTDAEGLPILKKIEKQSVGVFKRDGNRELSDIDGVIRWRPIKK